MLKALNELTAPEAKLLLQSNTSGAELMKLTLKELVLKQVLRIEHTETDEEGVDGVRIGRGNTFVAYKPHSHEAVFWGIFKDDDFLVEVSVFQKSVVEWIGTASKFKKQLATHLVSNGLLRQSFIQRLFQLYSTTEDGARLQTEIREALELLRHYREQESPDMEQVRSLVNKLGSVVLLSEHVDPEWLQGTFKEGTISNASSVAAADYDVFAMLLLWDMRMHSTMGSDGGWGDFDGGDFVSGWGSDGGGCSSDGGGGCSGCSGCGGCGGCGG